MAAAAAVATARDAAVAGRLSPTGRHGASNRQQG